MLGSKSIFFLVSLLTFSGLVVANTNASQSLADPNTKLSDSHAAPEIKTAETTVVKTEAQVDIQSDPTAADSIVESNTTPLDTLKSDNTQAVVAHPDLQVLEFVLADTVENREPKNIVDNFNKENKQGYAFARLAALKPLDVTFIWLRNGKEQTRFTTSVHASKKWRTFSAVKLKSGDWTVRLVSGDKIIAEKAFTIQ